MTGLATGERAAGPRAPLQTVGPGALIGGIGGLMAVALALRVIIAYLLPDAGFGIDLNAFRYWASDLAQHGPFGFYERGFFADYTPGYLYVLWLVGLLGRVMGGIGDLIKVPAMLSDVAVGWLIHRLILDLGGSRRRALLGAALFLFNPITWFDSTVWGQVDSVGVVLLLLGLRELGRERLGRATALAVLAAIVKPQLGILLPIVAAVVIRRQLVDRREGRLVGLVTTGGIGLLTAALVCLPFGMTVLDLFRQVARAATGYPFLTVNAYNPWALISRGGSGLAANGLWIRDVSGPAPDDVGYAFGPLPAVLVGTALLLLVVSATALVVGRRPTRLTMLVGLTVLAVAFFVVPTRVHERYLFPFFALGAILAALSTRWLVVYVPLAAASFANLYVVLTTLYPDNPGISDWLDIGGAIRSAPIVTLIALVHLAGFAWIAAQMRHRAARTLEREVVARHDEAREVVPVGSSGPDPRRAGATWSSGPLAAGLRSIGGRALRRDRSRRLDREPRGRLDRLDLWMLVVVVLSALVLRTFRLSEPYSMHFDEVYHARTATEFLQDWRYGIPHDIYEYTHPHLAKYAMAAGLVLFGHDQVTSRGDLGVPVRDAAIEPRWLDPSLPGGRAGDRVYVATGSEIRAYDVQTRALVVTVPLAGASTLALDQDLHVLYVGSETGEVWSIQTGTAFDLLRAGLAQVAATPPSLRASLGSPVRGLLATGVGPKVVVATAADEVLIVDATDGQVVRRLQAPGFRQLLAAGSSQQVVADPSAVDDPAAEARALAGIIGQDAAVLEEKLGRAEPQVALAPAPTASARAALDEAVSAGTLPGVSIQTLPQFVIIDAAGLIFSLADGSVTSSLPLPGARGGVVSTGLDAPRLYVAAGSSVAVVRLPADSSSSPPALETTLKAPGPVERVTFDPATTFVHVLGRTPDGATPTIYVIEPHGNAIFADARLPFEPSAWVTSADPLRPATDRQEILAFSADGAVASVDAGGNPFAWRLPGVVAGALTAGLLYVLARLLFRRRSVGILAGLLVLVDGMTYVQSRIAMNDVYVGLFIVAAYAVFAAVWTGAWRGRLAFWVGMPLVGVLLGLAIASKWVGLYALAGIVILILARSALGRLVILVGMIAATAALGYMGLVVAPDATHGGNVVFALAMIALTLAAVLIVVLHPIEWSVEEVRFAVAAPAGAGIALLLLAIPLGKVGAAVTVGSLHVSVLSAALAAIVISALVAGGFWIAGRLGFGPLSPATSADAAARLGPATPAAEGWLRLGSRSGLPAIWMAISLAVAPVVVYVVSYLPWVALGNRLTASWPPGNAGQTLADLTKSMYNYHNSLRATHAASSPWWAWPFDLKPVWFYQGSFEGGTAAAIYDAGNLAIWWLGIPALAFCAWQAYRRQSVALALIVVGFAWQWLPWVRIDRATFQYHYYTSLPFLALALAYFLAELWHGPSPRTWLLARASAAVAIVGPALLWVGKAPLCRFVGVEVANPGSQACVGNPGDLVVTARVAGVVVVMLVALGVLLYQLLRRDQPPPGSPGARTYLAGLAATAGAAAVGVVIASALPASWVLISLKGFQSSYLALFLAVPLVLVAGFVVTARDARRFVAGAVFATVLTFVVLYPNISALPLPSTIVNAYQGVLPTYLYPFQFPVNTDPVAPGVKLFALEPAVLLLALTLTALVVGYAAWVWRIGPPPAEEAPADEPGPALDGPQD